MQNETEIYTLLQDLCQKGEYSDYGCCLDEIEIFIDAAKKINTSKHVCIICDWQWWDLNAEELNSNSDSDLQRYPCVIMANYVIEDQAGRFNQGDWVRSSFLTQFHQNCIFETSSAFYLLVGAGTRKSLNQDQIKAKVNAV